MGEIYLAKVKGPVGFEKLVVIKRILAQHMDNEDYVKMFFSEARLAAKLSHSNIVQLYDMGQVEDSYYHAMEFIHGRSVRDVIDRAKQLGHTFHAATIIRIISAMAAGLSYAHNLRDMAGQPLNIIHRDINPHNVMVSYAGDVKIIDFGIAKSEVNEHKTETGTLKGKFVYMSPEQSAAEPLDKRSDIFALGICMYEMMAYKNPFAKANVVLSLDAIQRFDPPLPSTISPKFAPFDPIMSKALAKLAEDRYGDASEMRDDLQRLLLNGEVKPAPMALPDLMVEFFEQDIERHKRMLLEMESVQPPAEPQAPALEPEPQAHQLQQINAQVGPAPTPQWVSGSGLTPGTAPGQQMPMSPEYAYSQPGMMYVQPQQKSNKLAIFLIVVMILFVGAGGSALIIKFARDRASRFAGITEVSGSPSAIKSITPVAPVSGVKNVTPTPSISKPVAKPPLKTPKSTPEPKPVEAQPSTPVQKTVIIAPKPTPKPAKPVIVKKPEKKPANKVVKPVEIPAPVKPAGMILVNSSPTAQVFIDGKYAGQTPGLRVTLNKDKGRIVVGDAQTPFKITFSYTASDSGMRYTINSAPWAIVKRNNMSLGRTPRSVNVGGGAMKFDFMKPGAEKMFVVLRFSPAK